MNIGICGGTFDPFHRGHLGPVLAVRGSLQWSQIVYVPAAQQPFKTDRNAASGYHRFAMAVLATEALEGVSVSPTELERGSTSYTVDTLEELHEDFPGASFDWIIGDDNLDRLAEWKNIDRILELARFVVLTRNSAAPPLPPPKFRDRMVFAKNETVPVSSTEIRKKVREGKSISDLVDPRVSRYIQHNHLYREVQKRD